MFSEADIINKKVNLDILSNGLTNWHSELTWFGCMP